MVRSGKTSASSLFSPLFLFSLCLALSSSSAAHCDQFSDCESCSAAKTWTGSTCRWCPLANDLSCHAEGSLTTKCNGWQVIADPSRCASAAHPALPTQIHLALAGEIGTSMTVSWHTSDSVPNATLRWGLAPDALTSAVRADTRSYLLAGSFHHHATIPDGALAPDTIYYYQCAAGGAAPFSTSSVLRFQSAPAAGSERPFSVSVLGDWGYGEKGNAVDTRRAMESLKDNVSFVWHVGDISYADDALKHDPVGFGYENVYDSFMNWIQNLSAFKPYMVSVGNHESECHSPYCVLQRSVGLALSNFSAYNARFRMPYRTSGGTSNMWYSFDHGLAHFVSLDTETDFDGAGEERRGDSKLFPAGGFGRTKGEYLAWLEADLAKANASRAVRPWIIAGGHRMLYDERKGDGHGKGALRDAVEGLFEKYGVQLYMCGHRHLYARSHPIKRNGVATPRGGTGGTVHWVLGSAGGDEGHSKAARADKRGAWSAYVDDTHWGSGVLTVLNRTHVRLRYIVSSTLEVADEVYITNDNA